MKSQLFKINSLRNSFLPQVSRSYNTSDEVMHTISIAGYRGEIHRVQTEDGYILKVHRVLPVKHSVNKGAAFLMHGLFRNASDYLASGPNIALAYYLADNGYDVWLGNARGTKHSTEHVNLPVGSKDFWKFSFHEIGLYDVSAMLNFMLDHTKELRTFYVGHSQGTTSLMVLLSSLPKYNHKIIQAHLMTPAVFMQHSTSPMLTIPAKRAENIIKYASKVGKVNIAPVLRLSHRLFNLKGYRQETAFKFYKNFTCLLVGKNKNELEISEEALRTFQDFMSPAVSMMQLTHFLQLHVSGKFHQYDHGEGNHMYYDSPYPPEYSLCDVTAQIHLHSASEDLLVRPSDVELLKKTLPNAQHEILEDWNHMDVMYGRNSRTILYKNILKTMNAVS